MQIRIIRQKASKHNDFSSASRHKRIFLRFLKEITSFLNNFSEFLSEKVRWIHWYVQNEVLLIQFSTTNIYNVKTRENKVENDRNI
uniref:Ovule protein n=1 Tax=Romanomermis culicivorax TaxID=13658 RepID=A0A915KW38_ROMCU